MRKRRKLTEADWDEVFRLRCCSKQGQHVSEKDLELLDDAWNIDPERYRKLNAEIFNATVPPGSTARRKDND